MAEPEATQTPQDEFAIKPQTVIPALDTSNWPLLLRNYDKRALL
jgi:H/ACA ribonucleoprotein complex subunit 4